MAEWKPENVPDNFYRVSVKALILNENRDKFLVQQEPDGMYEVPGGGLDFGEFPQDGLKREIFEEMNLKVTRIGEHPCYFTTGMKSMKGFWNCNVIYAVELESLDFTPTEECVAIKFVGKEDMEWLNTVKCYGSVSALLKVFDPKNH